MIADFDFDIEYIEGKTNIVADGLSRRPDHIQNYSVLGAISSVHAVVQRIESHTTLSLISFSISSSASNSPLTSYVLLYVDPAYQEDLTRLKKLRSNSSIDGRLV